MSVSLKMVIIFSLVLITRVSAHDHIQPEWRGQEGTMFQQFRFDIKENPAVPELINNPYGQTTATINVGPFGEGWIAGPLPGFGTQTGFWDLGYEGRITVEIDNSPSTGTYEEIWIQVTYCEDFWPEPNVFVTGAVFLNGQTILIEENEPSGGWYLGQSIWRLEPITNGIEINITADELGSQIDQIAVDVQPHPQVCFVGFDDLEQFCSQWLMAGYGVPADFDNSGSVDFYDFSIFANSWAQICPSEWPFE